MVGRAVPAVRRSAAVRNEAPRANTHASQSRIDNLLNFNGRLNAHQAGDVQLARIYERRLRPAFVPAYRAWIAEEPFTNPDARPGPLYMPPYPCARRTADEPDA